MNEFWEALKGYLTPETITVITTQKKGVRHLPIFL